MQTHSHSRSQGHASTSWHNLSPEKRPLRRHKMGAPSAGSSSSVQESPKTLNSGHPDVYPQDPKQEEDKMSENRLQQGYKIPVPQIEYESLVKNPRFQERHDESLKNSAKWIIQIMQKKNEQNVISLDKKRIKEGTFQGFAHTASSGGLKGKEHQKFFEELVRGHKSLQSLSKRFPYFKRKDECMEYLYSCKVPIQKAIWFFKMSQVAHSTMMVTQNKQQKKSSLEQYSADQTKLFAKYFRDMLKRFHDGPQLLESLPTYQRWPYFICLFKHSFEEGILDRHDFLMDLCDIPGEYSNFPLEKPQLFRMLIIFLSQFVDVITQNVFLARKVAYIISSRLRLYKKDYERKKNSITNASECFNDLIHCQHHRALVLTMLGLLHAIIIDCPAALIWNTFDSQTLPQQLCGSPLDLLPCSANVLTQHLPKSANKIDSIITMRLEEIKKRSRDVENRWSLTPNKSNSSFECIVDVCLNVLSSLDGVVLNSPKALVALYQSIFCSDRNEKIQDLLIRIRLLIQWAVTTEREGTHRAVIVCHLLKMRKRHYKNTAFGSHQLQDLLIDYLNKEGPTPDNPRFDEEFANLMLLFYELQQSNLFNHNAYVRALMRYGQFSYQEPVLSRLRHFMHPASGLQSNSVQSGGAQAQSSTLDSTASGSAPMAVAKGEMAAEHPAIISFIPTTSTSQPVLMSSSQNGSGGGEGKSSLSNSTNSNGQSSESEEFAALLPESVPSTSQAMMEKPSEMSLHERFLIHLPIEQAEQWRDACNQRSILLYGISDERELAKQELRKVALQICRIWQRKVNVEFFHNSKEVRFKRRITSEGMTETLAKFKSQTYYDQMVICGWCAESLLDMFKDFFHASALTLPTSECLDILCHMMETCQNYRGIIAVTVELIPELIRLERVLSTFHSDCMPGAISCQLAYVLVSCLADNFFYFLYSKEASNIVNGLYRLVEKELCAVGYPITGWARAIAVFVYHARSELLNAQLNDQPLLGSVDIFRRLFPEPGAGLMPEDLRYNGLLWTDFLREPKRFYCYHDYKLHLPSIEDAHTRYSFVVNSFLAARNSKRDYDRLAELSNICGHVSVQKPMAGEWCVAVQELCYSCVSKSGYSHLIREINVNDLSTHYSLATFVILLASKYCFSSHALIMRLVNNVFVPIIKADNLASNTFEGSEMGLCLALQIVSGIVCGTDTPFLINFEPNTPKNQPKKLLELRGADLRALKIIHIRELDACIFPLLSAVAILMDMLKKRLNEQSNNRYRLSCLYSVVKCSLLAMCEQEWVVSRVFRICETQKNMDSFNCSRLKEDSIGQLLLRIALRRRVERQTKEELMMLRGDGGMKKARFDKLLSSITLWNMRATFFDFKKSNSNALQMQQQRSLFANHFIADIGKYCKDLFVNCKREDYYNGPFNQSTFRFHHINCYWLIAPLISVCPKPDNIPQMVTGSMTVTVKAKFLDEAASVLDGVNGASAQLLGQQPFLNLILTCIQGEEIDNLVGSLLRHIQAIITKAKENPTLPYQSSFMGEREGLLLRLNLVGGIFDSLLQTSGSSEPWALALFQLMFYEIISSDRDKQYFDVCFDMLSTLVHSMMTSSNSQSAYNGWVRKIRKELGDRPIPSDLNCLAQILPIAKSKAELSAWDCFSSANSPQKPVSTSKAGGSSMNGSAAGVLSQANWPQPKATRLDKQPQLVQKQLMRLLYHNHYSEFPSPGVLGAERQQQQRSERDVFLQAPQVEYYVAENEEEDLRGDSVLSIPSSNPPTSMANRQQQQSTSAGGSMAQRPAGSNVPGSQGHMQQSSIFPSMPSSSNAPPPHQPNILQHHQPVPKELSHPTSSQQRSMFEGGMAHQQMPSQQQQQPGLMPQHHMQQQSKFEPGMMHAQQQLPSMLNPMSGMPSQQQPQQPNMPSSLHLHSNTQLMPEQHTQPGIYNQPPHPMGAAAAVAGFLSAGHHIGDTRSGSSTPILGGTAVTSSPQRGVGRGGGRRKNAAAGPSATTTSTGRGQKRKKMEGVAGGVKPPQMGMLGEMMGGGLMPPHPGQQQQPQMMGVPPGGVPPPHILQQQQQSYITWQMQHQPNPQQQPQFQPHQPPQQQQAQFQQQQRLKKQHIPQPQQPPMMMGAVAAGGPMMAPSRLGPSDVMPSHHQMSGMMSGMNPHQGQQVPGAMMHGGGGQQPQQQATSDSKHNLQLKILQKMNAQQHHHGSGGGSSMQM